MVTNAQINPDAFYDQDGASRLLQMPAANFTRAVNAGELKRSVRGGRPWYRGSWLIAWLEGENAKQETEDSK